MRPPGHSPLFDIREAAIPVDLAAAISLHHFDAGSSSQAEPTPAWLDTILSSIGDARVVLIGEATHGTEEFYRVRALISKHLIEKHGFSFVAVEGDFPDIYRSACMLTAVQCTVQAISVHVCRHAGFCLVEWTENLAMSFSPLSRFPVLCCSVLLTCFSG